MTSRDRRRCECSRRALFRTAKDRRVRHDKHHGMCLRCFRRMITSMKNRENRSTGEEHP